MGELMDKPHTRKRTSRPKLYSNGQYPLQAVLQHSGVSLDELCRWRQCTPAPPSQRKAKIAIERLQAEIAHLRLERQAVRDAIAALAKGAAPRRPILTRDLRR